jgi:acetoacetyl-CoA reductase
MSQKVAYVTGGMGGIGTAICQRLHKEGFKVIAGCGPTRDHAKWIGRAGGAGLHLLRIGGQCGRLGFHRRSLHQDQGRARQHRCAGEQRRHHRDRMFLKMTREDWDAVIETNLNSMFNVTKQVVADMVEKGWGRIINISSVNGEKGQAGPDQLLGRQGRHARFLDGAGAGAGHQGRDGQHREPGLHRHRHGQGHPRGRAGQDRGHRAGQAPG